MKIRSFSRGMSRSGARRLVAIGVGVGSLAPVAQAVPLPPTPTPTTYQTLNFGTTGTLLTGIRGDNIVGFYQFSGGTGGLYYNMTTETWSPFPEATSSGVNFPDAIGNSPYGPSFGNPDGVLRVVGSYNTTESSPFTLSYLYDGAAAPERQLTTLTYPTDGVLFTIAHSNFGNQVVGNYDTRLATGNAFIYNIATGAYTTNNRPGAVSTTAYGVYGDMIAGGYANVGPGGGIGFEHGYLYNQTTDTWTTYDHPDAIITHLEGITGAGRSGEYNMVADWVTPDGVVHAGVLHVDALGIPTWYEITIPGATLVSSNSAYGDTVVGIYLLPDSTTPNGYVATIPGIYNPIRNTGTLTFGTANAAALDGRRGDDIINSGTIAASGNGGIGMRGETYGVLTNTGTITASGIAGAAVELHGLYGTFLNYGTLQTTIVADALRTGPDANGTVIVNMGVIDGRIAATAGIGKRFENSGWLGVTGDGPSVTHLFGGTFVQTSVGTYAARVSDSGSDYFGIAGTAKLAGTLQASFLTTSFAPTTTLIAATGGITGTFDSFVTAGLPALFRASLDYAPTTVTMSVAADLAGTANTRNQRAVGAAIDGIINTTTNGLLTTLPTALAPLYGLSSSALPATLSALSGEAYASEQSVMVGDSLYSRRALLDRLRQGTYVGQSGPMAALGYGGPALAYAPSAKSGVPYPTKAPAAPEPAFNGTIWAQAFGGWSDYSGGAGTASVDATIGGILSGVDINAGNWLVGAALGYTQSSSDIDALASSTDVDSLLLALYAGTSSGPWNLRLGASYAFNQIDASRTIAYPFAEQASAEYDGGTAQVFAEVGYGFALQQLALEPFAGLAYVYLDTDSFTETGASAGLYGASGSMGVGYSTLGLRVATTIDLPNGMSLKPHASVAWQYAFGDITPEAQMTFLSVPTANFTVAGVPLAENTALVEIGADLNLTEQARIGVSYVGQYADSVTVNAVQANLTWRF